MPEICPDSVPHSSSLTRRSVRQTKRPSESESAQSVAPPAPPNRSELFRQLMRIQINTAGLSGPYRSAEETLERVKGNHSAVREVRKVLRRSLILPRRGPLWDLLVAASLRACNGDLGRAARMLGASIAQLRRALLEQTLHQTH